MSRRVPRWLLLFVVLVLASQSALPVLSAFATPYCVC